MNNNELIKLKEQLEKERNKIREGFSKFCNSKDCLFTDFASEDEKNELYNTLLDGEQYDELEVEIPNMFFFDSGTAKRKFEIYRKKGGMLNQFILKINELLGEESDDFWWDEYSWGKEGLESLIEQSKKAIAEEEAFIEFAEKGLKILEELPNEE